jgi:small subunit ribosomal protein S1
VSEDQKGPDKGFGRKKPRATFGDAMLGIPAGRGESRERPRAIAAATSLRPPQRGDARSEPPRREPKKPERRKPQARWWWCAARAGIETRGRSRQGAAPEAAAGDRAAPAEPRRARHAASRAPRVATALYEEVPRTSRSPRCTRRTRSRRGGPPQDARVGERVTGTIFQLGADTAFLTLDGRTEAMIDLRELKDDEGILRFGVGDTVEAHVVEAGAKGVILSRTLSKGSASLAMLAEARASGMPVEGPGPGGEQGRVRGGGGRRAAFVPLSQMDLRFVDKPDQYIGERLRFRVTEVRERNVVLSRRALLEDEQKALAAETRKSLAEGKVLQGKVTGVRDFGVFVDLGGVEGLVPVSELSHVAVGPPERGGERRRHGRGGGAPHRGAEPALRRTRRSTRSASRCRCALARRTRGRRSPRGSRRVTGSRARWCGLQPFGAFVELRPGVDGPDPHLGDVRAAHRHPATC